MTGLWKDNGYQHTYHSCQLRKEEVKRGKRKAVAEQQDGYRRRHDSADDNSGSMGGALISPAIVAAARYAVMVAAAIRQQMRCCMPAVVDNQLQKFENDPEIRQLVGPSQIAFSGLPHAPPVERRNALLQSCTDQQQPRLPITFTQFGYNSDFPLSSCTIGQEEITFESRFILNGVCVILRGILNRELMTGSSTLQFDEQKAAEEELHRQQAMQQYGDRIQAIRQRFNLPQS
ncbi:Core binding factor beta subunit family protein [Brugia pahangi]